ncbi:Ergothioneine biosynthesis protein 1 [Mollisiaceae sp. DMI_Dod_QoI]|nr:Ergothioneine biosynthesis protein 1 [Helotiales sp. DMI_Dod_QoI]
MAIPGTSNSALDLITAKTIQRAKILDLPSVSNSEQIPSVDIIDIRHDAVELNLKEEILTSLRPQKGPKQLPTLLLYDERGLQLFEQASLRQSITYLDEYYLTNAEIDVLKSSAHRIAEFIPSSSMVIELGSGNLRKVSILLQALDSLGKSIDYYALDLSLKELKRTLEQVPPLKHVKCHGLHGTYDDGLEWLKVPENAARQKCIMSLGSSIGNFHRHEAASFLGGFSNVLQPSDSMLIGLDATNDPAKVFHAYNDREGITHKFILNGLLHANEVQGEQVFNLEDWKVIGEYAYDGEGGRHQAFYSPIRDIRFGDIQFKAGERIQVEQSLKYSTEEALQLWQKAGLSEVDRWSASSDAYNIHLLTKNNMGFNTDPVVYARTVVPTLDDWKGLWAEWDTVTRKMIPETEMHEKPIKLRNACIFYLGHIPTFLDIQLTKATKEPPTEPSHYPQIFERGIDPDVDNPEQCHAHSEIPDEWPPLQEILIYQDRVREKVRKLTQVKELQRHIARALWIGFEHEIMHLETLLYMLLQSDRTVPPTKHVPDFEGAARLAEAARVPNQWFRIPEQRISIGLDDPEDNSGPDHHFGWDNEKPLRTVVVQSFEAQGRPITNEDYALYLEQTHNSKIPASWTESKIEINGYSNGYSNGYFNGYTNGASNGHHNGKNVLTKAYLEGKSVRTVYGLVPLKYALDWPVFTSYDELAGCAIWMGGRIPTFEEARSIYSHVDGLQIKEAEQHLGKTVPAVNGHLSNDGVEETPPSQPLHTGESTHGLFTNLEGANVGFKHWHPVAVTSKGNMLAGQADMGGVWEWTSSPLTKHDGFEPMPLYPGYTADFFDGKHNIVLGGSWATHPRIAGRRTFVNWYQRNYPYVWAGARLVRDL